MTVPLQRYRLYGDESGDHVFHDQATLRKSDHRYLALVGCWFQQGEPHRAFCNALEEIKHRHFPHSPDEPVVLHRKELVHGRKRFWRLRDEGARDLFDADLCALAAGTTFTLIGICIDKLRIFDEYGAALNPYHVALSALLERYCGWLNFKNRSGDVMVESRGGIEDGLLKDAYDSVWTRGTWHRKGAFFQRTLTSKQVKLNKKYQNIAGLQLADLLARAVRDDILVRYGRLAKLAPFDARLLAAAAPSYNRDLSERRIDAYERFLLPK